MLFSHVYYVTTTSLTLINPLRDSRRFTISIANFSSNSRVFLTEIMCLGSSYWFLFIRNMIRNTSSYCGVNRRQRSRFLSTPISNIGVPLEAFLTPCENDPSLLNSYLFYLASGKIRETWCPVLYCVALHHVSVFIQSQPDNETAKQLKSRVEKLGNQELKTKILNYISPSEVS
ncbi:RNA polymerase II-associated protein 1-like isoform X1 [Diaphorina citri]|uniref:RNA polymerase II-associated protein 1-like isoform X1 n=1 Tax=Diaphorina citri TaxID=121845 RepID=A0A1S3DN59_DIACI|nr:RNA polymerase II-associated protein 1-like isoform X1 [Diaphorina citri]